MLKKSLSILLALQIIFSVGTLNQLLSHAADSADAYAEVVNVNDDNVYVLLGNEVVENDCQFLDAGELGITDASHPLYNEISVEKGIDGRKYYAANYMTLDVEQSKFTDEDNEFLIYITYYDYGPYRGYFYLEYIDKDGQQQSVRITKPGTVQRFNTECVYVKDIDFFRTLDITGGDIRIKSGAYNLFKRIEIVNFSKFKRENRSLNELAKIPEPTKIQNLIDYGIIDKKSEKFQISNLKNECTYGDAYQLFTKISNGRSLSKNADYKAADIINQKDMVLMALEVLNLNSENVPPLDYARKIGIIKDEDFIYSEEVAASYHSLVALVDNSFNFKNDKGTSIFEEMVLAGYWDDNFIKNNRTLIAYSYKYPKYMPYTTITENATGQTYHYMNIMNIPTLRTYVTSQSWNSDATGFICGFDTGEIFYYDTESQMLHYIDKCYNMTDRLNAVMGTDDCIYYPKIDDEGYCGIYKVDINVVPAEPQFVGRRKDKYTFNTPHISNDCKYFSVDLEKPGLGTCVSRYSVDDDEWIDYHKEFPYSDALSHVLINPEYPDLFSFAHELSGATLYELLDRMWQIDLSTGEEAKNLYKQGVRFNGKVIQGASHEVWSNMGEYVYFINTEMYNEGNIGLSPSSVRYNKDGTHRQYFYDHTASENKDKHLYPSGDDKWIVADGNTIVLISQETHERFVISIFDWNGYENHPYHAHPVVARNKYVVNWAAIHGDVLGIKWFDFTELAKKQAKGGRDEAGEHLERISYLGLDSESSKVVFEGKDAIMAKKGNSIYLDVSDEFIDTVNGKIKITFNYFDNGVLPIKLSYTSGVETDNDLWRVYDNSKTINRTNSKKWKSCEILIESGNFENIGKHFSDIKITGSPATLYISDLKVSIPE